CPSCRNNKAVALARDMRAMYVDFDFEHIGQYLRGVEIVADLYKDSGESEEAIEWSRLLIDEASKANAKYGIDAFSWFECASFLRICDVYLACGDIGRGIAMLRRAEAGLQGNLQVSATRGSELNRWL